ncbi:MAG: hypothetical protein CME30_02175 [Gemmatimonadetes bacterium]|uniref:Transglycosylase associated protein n=1 Tax=marine metagenome TaxID=408172 RepID=A0A382I893_9ZZZZ|nr:hypothetical protein [Gemmatimonadota bacterium]|tara:strand:- start:129 stop:407 length:279 start_codon:yes stop_codon:yes gene_type:complete
MENWIGIGIWVIVGCFVGLLTRKLVRRPEETSGHLPILLVLSSFGAAIGGMLGVGIFEFQDPIALSPGGMGGAIAFSFLISFIYRWGIRGLL